MPSFELPDLLTCGKCGEQKPPESFNNDASTRTGKNRWCKACRRARMRELPSQTSEKRLQSFKRRKAANPERYARAVRNGKFRQYGWDAERYEAQLAQQDGVCGICLQPETGGWDLAVDHDHVSGRVRGLLCKRCNVALGLLREDAATVQRAAYYLVVAELAAQLEHPD